VAAAEPIAARHQAVVERLTEAARADERVLAAWLQGSRADGTADDFSDIDFYVAVADDAYQVFDKLAFIASAAPVLVHLELPAIGGVVCLLAGPVKLDFFAERASAVEGRPRPAVQVLMDKGGVAAGLSAGWTPDERDVARQVDELLRLTFQGATWPVRLLKREQWLTHAFSELSLLHGTVLPLILVQRDPRAFHRNPMTRERLLSEPERRELDELAGDVLRALADRSLPAAYRAHLRIVEALSRAGRAACAQFGLAYPEAAEREAVAFYEREWPG
jgi:predicted nucleotidyltransferase